MRRQKLKVFERLDGALKNGLVFMAGHRMYRKYPVNLTV